MSKPKQICAYLLVPSRSLANRLALIDASIARNKTCRLLSSNGVIPSDEESQLGNQERNPPIRRLPW